MDPEEAFAQLGLEAPASAEAIRRAYLRSVREHPPERDADGFRRVREAYDLLRKAPWLWLEKQPAKSEPSASAELVVVPRDEAGHASNANNGSADAVNEAPVNEAPAAPTAPVAAELMVAVGQAVRGGKINRAAKLLLELLTAPEHREIALVPTWQALEVALRLVEAGRLARARELVEALDRRVTALGLGATAIGPVVIARWTLVSELLALDPVVSDEFTHALAHGVRSGDFDDAVAFFKKLRKNRLSTLEDVLKARAPSLHKTLATEVRPRGVRTRFTWWRWLWIGYLLLQVARCGAPKVDHWFSPAATQPLDAPHNLADKETADPWSAWRTTVRSIDDAVQRGDCNTVRELWPDYRRGMQGTSARTARDSYALRRQQALEMCRELEGELSEVP